MLDYLIIEWSRWQIPCNYAFNDTFLNVTVFVEIACIFRVISTKIEKKEQIFLPVK